MPTDQDEIMVEFNAHYRDGSGGPRYITGTPEAVGREIAGWLKRSMVDKEYATITRRAKPRQV